MGLEDCKNTAIHPRGALRERHFDFGRVMGIVINDYDAFDGCLISKRRCTPEYASRPDLILSTEYQFRAAGNGSKRVFYIMLTYHIQAQCAEAPLVLNDLKCRRFFKAGYIFGAEVACVDTP